MLRKFLRKLLLRKEIKSKEDVLHFQRWGIWTPWFGVYLHLIYKADKDLHPHSHPWNFRTFVLRGGYREVIWDRSKLDADGMPLVFQRSLRPLLTAYTGKQILPVMCFHQLEELYGPTWTLVFTGRDRDQWGYLVERVDKKIPPFHYVYLDHETYRIEKRKGRWRESNN